MDEQWRRVKGVLGYSVSSLGRVRNDVTDRCIKPTPSNRGYLYVSLGRAHKKAVHRLVAVAFCKGQKPGYHVDHIDFDRTNNAATNLRWLHAVENSVRWAGRTKPRREGGRNIWTTPDDVPEGVDDTTITAEEWARWEADVAANGWRHEQSG